MMQFFNVLKKFKEKKQDPLMKPCGVTKASSASHIIVASVLLSVGCIGWRESLEIKERPLNPFFPHNALNPLI